MELILHPDLEHIRAELTEAADQALGAARLRAAMRGRRVYATWLGRWSRGGSLYHYKMAGKTIWADARVIYKSYDTWYRSYRRRQCSFWVTELTSIQCWARAAAHEAEHVRQHTKMVEAVHEGRFEKGQKWFSEVEADRAALRAAIRLGWGRVYMQSGRARSKRRRPNRKALAVV